LCSSDIKVLVDAEVYSGDEKVIKCEFKPGSVEKWEDVQNEPI
jgi:hypothetical protein